MYLQSLQKRNSEVVQDLINLPFGDHCIEKVFIFVPIESPVFQWSYMSDF